MLQHAEEITCKTAPLFLGWPCRRQLLAGAAAVSKSSLSCLQGLMVQFLLFERGEEMTFTQLSEEQQETLVVRSSGHFPPPRIRHSEMVLTDCQGLAATNILAKYVDDSWQSGVHWFKWWAGHSVMDLKIPDQIVLSFVKQEAGRLCFNQLIASLGKLASS